MDADWDLNAVVRGCSASSSTTAATSSSATTSKTTTFQQDYTFISNFSQDLFETRRGNSIEELHDLYKPFYRKSQTELLNISSQSLPISPLSVLGGLQDPSSEQQIMKQLPHQTQIKQNQQSFLLVNGSKAANSQNSRSKRRKNSLKRVCHVAAENLSSDMWSWRKYGQKPIKGSPYPRGYYKCSTSKGCMARKQVERNRSDPGMFIVTYTAEHNHPMPTHRNSLAGSTRQKPAGTPNSDDTSSKPSCSSEMSQATSLDKLESRSREDDLAHAQDDDGVDFGGSNMVLDDDFFAGLEDFTGADGECFSDHFSMSLPLPWVENSASTGARSC